MESTNVEVIEEMTETKTSTTVEPFRRSQRQKKEIERFQAGFKAAFVYANITEPNSYKEAMDSRYVEEWKEAMDSEMRSQTENKTWKLIQRPSKGRVQKNRWVFKIKPDVNGGPPRFKARLVVKGYNQVEGVDFEETFSPVCRYESLRCLLSVAAGRKLNIIQFDVSTAFLNSKLEEDIYMDQPEGYKVNSDLICKLEKGLYGLKQAPRNWHKTLTEKLLIMDFQPFESDS